MAQAPRALTPEASPLDFFGARLRYHRTAQSLSQNQLGRLVHVSGHLIGKIETAGRWPTEALIQRLDEVLQAHGELTRLWPALAESRQRPIPAAFVAGEEPRAWPDCADGSDEDVLRRDVCRIAAAGVAATALPPLNRLMDWLTGYALHGAADDGSAPSLASARVGVASVKRMYQACRYTAALDELPTVLSTLDSLSRSLDGDAQSETWTLSADAYHVVGSILLKLGDVPLATVAADRSMAAARRSGDLVAVAGSARIVTHALMAGGHPERAHTFAVDTATRLMSSLGGATRGATSVLGALLLRSSIAAARADRPTEARDILEEAERAAGGVAANGNDRWTGFNATNVQLHRVNAALVLGDAGTAVRLAGQIDPTTIELVERRATLHLDVAQAYLQWGKWERSLAALNRAAATAPQEVSTRPSARALIADLAHRAPTSVRLATADFATQLGVRL
jgi:transcriptional regulator with XRE-family HTH domain